MKKEPLYQKLAIKCLNAFWNTHATDMYGGGWDNGSKAHHWALKWAKKNINHLRRLTFAQVFKEYKRTLVQE